MMIFGRWHFSWMGGLTDDDDAFIRDILGPEEDEDPIFGGQPGRALALPSRFPVPVVAIAKQAPRSPSAGSGRRQTSFSRPGKVSKCSHVFLGGTHLQDGVTLSEDNPYFCTSLFCISCDHPVLRFRDRMWSDTTNYLFLRNNYPDTVAANLLRTPRWCAYCCQCTFQHEQKLRKMPPFSTNWVCRGHQ
jgi:hypothetical protein